MTDTRTPTRLVANEAVIPRDAPPPSKALLPKNSLLLKFGKWAQPRINNVVARSSKVGNPTFFDTAQWPWVAELEAHWETIRDEAYAVLGDLSVIPPLAEISPDHRRIAPAGKWRSFFLYGYGYSIPQNCAACPKTAELVGKIPGLNTAMFSVLVPHTRIPAHTGVTKAILVSHLGIQVPRDSANCRMRVQDEWTEWQEGKAFVFDDCYNHEVINDTDEVRIVLLIQFRRPMRFLGRMLGGGFLWGVRHSRFVQDARRALKDWSDKRVA